MGDGAGYVGSVVPVVAVERVIIGGSALLVILVLVLLAVFWRR